MSSFKREITRRDFINGTLIGAGSLLLGGCDPISLLSGSDRIDPKKLVQGGVNSDPRALFGGNLPGAFTIAHWMRDRRLVFGADKVEVKASTMDGIEGSFPIDPATETYDIIILGSGIAGLSTAFFLLQQKKDLKILILDANQSPGGNSAFDGSSEMPVISSTGTAYGVFPSDEGVQEIYRETGVDWEKNAVPSPFYSYFFDEQTPYVLPGTKKWVKDVYGKGFSSMPYPAEVMRDLESSKTDLINWFNLEGSPTDPPDKSDLKYDYLDQISYHDYITKEKKWHPAVADFYTRYCVDALCSSTKYCSAYAAIDNIAAEFFSIFAYPGGNSAIAHKFLNYLYTRDHKQQLKDVSNKSLDSSANPVRVRQGGVAVRVNNTGKGPEVIYTHNQTFHRAQAGSLVIATGMHSARHLIGHLLDEERAGAYANISMAPVPVCNVALRNAIPLVDLDLGYNQYWWGGKYFADFVTSDWVGANRQDRNRKTVLSFYGGNELPPEDMPAERMKLMHTPFSAYEASVREDLNRMFAATGFDFDRDVSGIHLYRWGHGMIYPKVGSLFGKSGRASAPRHIVRKPIGRIFFAGQDTEGTPSIESAIGSGRRAAREVLTY